MRVLVVGAGPIGLEAALRAQAEGHDVTVVEAGYGVGAGVRSWGHVRLFSPWRLDVSDAGRRALEATGHTLPDLDECPTGEEYCDLYLDPIAEYLADRVRFVFETDVVALGRGRVFKHQLIGDPARSPLPFRALLEGPEREYVLEFDAVLDCSGVLDTPNFLGTAGLPAIGEAAFEHRIVRGIPDVFGDDREQFAGATTLVVGDGLSAAATVEALLALRDDEPRTTIVWATASEGAPYARIPDDPLPARDRLAELGNAIAAGDHGVERIAGAGIEAIDGAGDRLRVTISDPTGATRKIVVDSIVANVGYRPNNAIAEELHFHACWATQAPMKLAATLLASGSADCMSQPTPGPDTLRNPEPRYFVLGAKSYGRNPNFLLRTGFEQVAAVVEMLRG